MAKLSPPACLAALATPSPSDATTSQDTSEVKAMEVVVTDVADDIEEEKEKPLKAAPLPNGEFATANYTEEEEDDEEEGVMQPCEKLEMSSEEQEELEELKEMMFASSSAPGDCWKEEEEEEDDCEDEPSDEELDSFVSQFTI